jgi:SAM-dependent methyltransferase
MVSATAGANERALAALDLSDPCTVLDVGFGQGRTVALLVRDGHRVLGVDASPTMVRQATARNRLACRDGRAQLRDGDGITIPFPDVSADAATLADIARVLRLGGRLVVACRTSDTATPAWMDPDVYRIPSAAQIVTMLHDVGFAQIEHHPGDESNNDVHLFVARLTDPNANPP